MSLQTRDSLLTVVSAISFSYISLLPSFFLVSASLLHFSVSPLSTKRFVMEVEDAEAEEASCNINVALMWSV
jgi:hypothetical protein